MALRMQLNSFYMRLLVAAIAVAVIVAFSRPQWKTGNKNVISSLPNGVHLNPSRLYASNKDDGKEEKKVKSTKFDRVVNDFIGKRYGAGSYFYGQRLSDLSEEEFAERRGLRQQKSAKKDEPMKDNAILIVGSLDEIGQWVAFELGEKGFNIRIACDDKQRAVNIFGENNVDIIELKKDSSEEQYATAIEGVQALVLCPNFAPKWIGLDSSECVIAERIVDMSLRAKEAKVGKVKKIVSISRCIPGLDEAGSRSTAQNQPKGGLIDSILSASADAPVYKSFRALHTKIEDVVRTAGFEYAVVRAPAVVEVSNAPEV
jgi:hypothetical protein